MFFLLFLDSKRNSFSSSYSKCRLDLKKWSSLESLRDSLKNLTSRVIVQSKRTIELKPATPTITKTLSIKPISKNSKIYSACSQRVMHSKPIKLCNYNSNQSSQNLLKKNEVLFLKNNALTVEY